VDRFGELKVFTRIVEAQGFSGAARAEGLTPSAVSKLVARLESRLGVLLFHRSSRQVGLTREGEQFYASACDILKSLDEAEAAVSSDNATSSGPLRVYVLPSFARWQLAPIMPAFLAQHPSLKVEFQLGNEPLRSLDTGLDVALLGGRLRDSSLMVRRIASSRWLVCASPAYLEAHGTPERPEDLHRHHCLNFAVGGDWNDWSFRSEDGTVSLFRAEGRLSSNHGDMLMAAAVAGAGIVRLIDFHVAEQIRMGSLVPVLQDFMFDEQEALYAIYHARRHISPRTRLFLDFLSDRFSQNPPWADIHSSAV